MPRLSHYLLRIRSHPHPARFLLSRILWRLGISRLLTIDCGTYRLRFYPTSLSADYWVDPREREHDEEFLKRYLRPGDTVVDVGANLGALALAASGVVGATGCVYAIEAHPRIFSYLVRNVRRNRRHNVRAIHCAVGDHAGTISFTDRRSDDQNAVDSRGALVVPLQGLDELLSDTPTAEVALLKIDVEGYEKFVLAGAEQLLHRTACIYFESWDDLAARFDYTPGQLVEWLETRGFLVYRLTADSMTQLDWRASSPVCENLIAVRDPAAFSLRYAHVASQRTGGFAPDMRTQSA